MSYPSLPTIKIWAKSNFRPLPSYFRYLWPGTLNVGGENLSKCKIYKLQYGKCFLWYQRSRCFCIRKLMGKYCPSAFSWSNLYTVFSHRLLIYSTYQIYGYVTDDKYESIDKNKNIWRVGTFKFYNFVWYHCPPVWAARTCISYCSSLALWLAKSDTLG